MHTSVLRCEEFGDKFLPFLKVEKEAIPNYKYHVAVLVRTSSAINVFLLYEEYISSSASTAEVYSPAKLTHTKDG